MAMLPSDENQWWVYAQLYLGPQDKLSTIKDLTNLPAGTIQLKARAGDDLSGSNVKIGDYLHIHAIWKRPYETVSPIDAHRGAMSTLTSSGHITTNANAQVLTRLSLGVAPTGQISSRVGDYTSAVRGLIRLAAAMGAAGRDTTYLDIHWLEGFHHTFGIFEQIEEGILSRSKAADETYVTIYFHAFVEALSSLLHPGGRHHKLEPKREPLYCTNRQDLHPSMRMKYFSAFIDGYIQTKGSPTVSGSARRPFLVMCEFKRASLRTAGYQVWMQETFEAAAVIAKVHAETWYTTSNRDCPDILFITQYGLDVSVVLGKYGPSYVDYLLDGHKPALVQIPESEMLVMHRLNVYSLQDEQQVYEFIQLLGSVLVTDVGST